MSRYFTMLGLALAIGVSFISGFAIGVLPREPAGALAPSATVATPDVAASNEWGQHTPRSSAGHARDGQPLYGQLRTNVRTDFNASVDAPSVHETAYVDPSANVAGHVAIGARVYVAPFASVRGDEGQPIHIGDQSNLQDGVVVHALATEREGSTVRDNTYEVDGQPYAVYVGEHVSLSHQSSVHGPVRIEDHVFVGIQALIFGAHIGEGVVVEPAATVIGVDVPAGRYVPAGSVVTSQQAANELPTISDSYLFKDLNRDVVHVNTSLADAYSGRTPPAAHR